MESMSKIALGMLETILVKMMSEMPLPTPCSLICSPCHMMNAVPVVKEITHITMKPLPALGTISLPKL